MSHLEILAWALVVGFVLGALTFTCGVTFGRSAKRRDEQVPTDSRCPTVIDRFGSDTWERDRP